jgi:hypothetical protein
MKLGACSVLSLSRDRGTVYVLFRVAFIRYSAVKGAGARGTYIHFMFIEGREGLIYYVLYV